MIEIDVIGGKRTAVISSDSKAGVFLKKLSRELVMRRLTSAEGDKPRISETDMRRLGVGFFSSTKWQDEIHFFVNLKLFDFEIDSKALDTAKWDSRRSIMSYYEHTTNYLITKTGLDLLARLRAGEEEIFITL